MDIGSGLYITYAETVQTTQKYTYVLAGMYVGSQGELNCDETTVRCGDTQTERDVY